ncbi:hypothetical protein F5Y15DRAFT_420770 [Xylariaceae sp. FL0016]|nr:hypothetical protein F5Y15DRAFT_420770 [Xylariaceae sp. FL0016]
MVRESLPAAFFVLLVAFVLLYVAILALFWFELTGQLLGRRRRRRVTEDIAVENGQGRYADDLPGLDPFANFCFGEESLPNRYVERVDYDGAAGDNVIAEDSRRRRVRWGSDTTPTDADPRSSSKAPESSQSSSASGSSTSSDPK